MHPLSTMQPVKRNDETTSWDLRQFQCLTGALSKVLHGNSLQYVGGLPDTCENNYLRKIWFAGGKNLR